MLYCLTYKQHLICPSSVNNWQQLFSDTSLMSTRGEEFSPWFKKKPQIQGGEGITLTTDNIWLTRDSVNTSKLAILSDARLQDINT